MSSYRPKSLDELNSRYDQALSAEQAIKKAVSEIKAEHSDFVTAQNLDAVSDIIGESTGEQITKPIEDISPQVDDLIRRFSGDSASAPPQKKSRTHPPQSQVSPVRSRPAAKPEPIVPADDRSDLLADYMRVMTDQYEDEEEPQAKPSLLKKKKLKAKSAKKAPVIEPAADIEESAASQNPTEAEFPDQGDALSEIFSSEAGTGGVPFEGTYPTQPKSIDETFDELDGEDRKKGGFKARRIVRVFLSLVLAASLVLTAGVISLELVLKVNTGERGVAGYYFVTTNTDVTDANIKAGDLVICEGTSPADGRYALCVNKDTNTFFFGRKGSGIMSNDGSLLYLIDDQYVERSNVLGSVKRSFGDVGSVIDLIIENYILILSVLVALSVVLFLVVTIFLRNKDKKAKKRKKTIDDDSEADDELPSMDTPSDLQPEASEDDADDFGDFDSFSEL